MIYHSPPVAREERRHVGTLGIIESNDIPPPLALTPESDVGVVWRRGLGELPELQVDLRKAQAHTPVAALVRVAGMRWPIETAFEEN